MVTEKFTPPDAPPESPDFSLAVRFWLRLGLTSFGGTAAHIGLMHEGLVQRRRWIDEETFMRALSHCMILPGPEAQQLAIYLGWKLNGIKGGIAAGGLFVLPSMLLLLGFSMIYSRFGNLPWIGAVLSGLRPVVSAMVLLAVTRLAKRALTRSLQWVVAGVAFAAMSWMNVSVPWVMAAAIALGWFLSRRRTSSASGEHLPLRGTATRARWETGRKNLAIFAKTWTVGSLVWLAPMFGAYLLNHDFSFWARLATFFTRSAFVTVGGSYTVIPYVAHTAVFRYHWLNQTQMLDGFSLAETTPGPLIIVVAFVGFMAGFHHFHGSLVMGTVALILTTLYTFLPCFLFVLTGASVADRLYRHRGVQDALSLIMAVVVAAMANLALFLIGGVLLYRPAEVPAEVEWSAGAAIVVSLYLLGKLKAKPVFVIAAGLAFGMARWLIHRI